MWCTTYRWEAELGTMPRLSMIRLVRLQTAGRDPLRPRQGASVPPCSPPSRCGLAKSEFAARLARRPTLTASARGGELSARSGRRNGFRIEQRNGPKQSLCQLFVITIREGAPRVSCSIIPTGPSSPHRLACSGLRHPAPGHRRAVRACRAAWETAAAGAGCPGV